VNNPSMNQALGARNQYAAGEMITDELLKGLADKYAAQQQTITITGAGRAEQAARRQDVILGSFEVLQAENGFLLRQFDPQTSRQRTWVAKDADELKELFITVLVTERMGG